MTVKRGRPKHERVLFLAGGFLEDPKIRSLSNADMREWLRVLLDHVRFGNGAELPEHSYGVSRRRLKRFLELGLLVQTEDSISIHNWDEWNGVQAYKRLLARERKRRQRGREGGGE